MAEPEYVYDGTFLEWNGDFTEDERRAEVNASMHFLFCPRGSKDYMYSFGQPLAMYLLGFLDEPNYIKYLNSSITGIKINFEGFQPREKKFNFTRL